MKKIVSLIVFCLMTIAMQAQDEHLKFMGIPLDGTIDQFQAKLLEKGLKVGELTAPVVGVRVFSGTFSGEKAEIFVYYNTKTNIVYRAKAVLDYPDRATTERKLGDYKAALNKKYSDCSVGHDDKLDGYPSYVLVIYDEDMNSLGIIATFVSYYQYGDSYSLHLDYMDKINQTANREENLDDL